MRIGIHLPQFGKALSPGGIQRAARAAEAGGFDDVFVSDHLVSPSEQAYPGPYLADPLQSLAFAAAATEHVGLVTSVLVGPQYTSPLALANTLASLDFLSGGRLALGIGIGWSKREYEALGASFDQRGRRLDEMLTLFRTVWEHDPADFRGDHYPSFTGIRVRPQPAHRIPIWVGGTSEASLERALRHDGYHGINLSAEDAGGLVERLRRARPDPGFTVSARVTWDARKAGAATFAGDLRALEDAGLDAVYVAPSGGDLDAWLAEQDALAAALRR